jgi:copper chaperone CopZ
MTHTYKLTGMTCTGCEAKVKSSLLLLPDVTAVEVSKDNNTATITMAKHISLTDLQNAIDGKYKITAMQNSEAATPISFGEGLGAEVSWFATYKPLLLIFVFIAGISIITARIGNEIHWMKCMNNFMAGFFLTFSFFKLLDINAFAESYAMYDIVAKRIKAYGFIYPFIELTLGIAFLIEFNPFVTNVVALIVMGISIIGVLQSVFKRQKIQCVCLGAVFKLPMSTVTIIEDALMIVMSATMLYLMK